MKLTPRNVGRIVEAGYRKTEGFRRSRTKFLQSFCGRFYGAKRSGDADERRAAPLNLIYNAVTTWVPNHVYNDPQVSVRTPVLGFRPYAEKLALATNTLIDWHHLNLRHTIRKGVTNSLFSAGFFKTGISTSDRYLECDGENVPLGQPYADCVSLDDMLLDPIARDWDEMFLVGNRFRVQREKLLDLSIYPNAAIEKLEGRYGGLSNSLEAGFLSDSLNSQEEANEFYDYVELAEIYIPSLKIIVTMPWGRGSVGDSFLNVVDYDGPDSGNYHMLGYAFVEDNLMPVAPVGIWYDLHQMANKISRKLGRQAERMKSVLAYEGSAADDAQQLMDAEDGESVMVDDVEGVKPINMGGVTDDAYKWMEWVKANFSEQAGNIDQLGGIKDNSPTATQAEMLNANTNVRLADTQGQVYDIVRKICRDLAFYLHTDPLIDLPLIQRKGGQDIQVHYTPEMRQGQWMDYFLDVEPFSMARKDPNVLLKRKMDFLTQVIPAVANAAQIFGPLFNARGALEDIAKDVGYKEIDAIINDPIMMAQVLAALPQTMPPPNKVMAGGMGMDVPPPQTGQGPTATGPGGFRPQQPNPGQMASNQGVASEQTMNNQRRQQTAGELQSTYLR